MPHDALIHDLSADLAPVRRRSVAREAALLLGLAALELVLFLGLGAMRPDMGQQIATPFMWWKLGGLALVAAIGCVTALGSLTPTASPRRGVRLTLIAAALVVIAGMMLDPGPASQAPLIERIHPLQGMGCALAIIVLSLPVVAMMAILMRRAAPTNAEGSALAIGLAAGSWGAFVFAFCCRFNDPLYVAIWYGVACAIVAAAARWLLPRGFHL